MAYATQQDIIDRYGEAEVTIAADRNDDGEIDATVVGKALDDVSGTIDTLIGKTVPLPLTAPFPPVLVSCAIDMGLYRLSLDAGVLTDEKTQRNKDCVKLLMLIGAGKADIGVPLADGTVVGTVELDADDREWTRADQRGIF